MNKVNFSVYHLLLFLAALIWGFSFVAQKLGMQYIQPFWYNGIRFMLGSFVLLPFFFKSFKLFKISEYRKVFFKGGLIAGLFLFAGANLQQIGIQYTTAGNAGLITGLYVILVPVAGIMLGYKTKLMTWIGVILGLVGMYFLSVKDGFYISKGDLYVLASAVIWTGHVLTVAVFSPKVNPLQLAYAQFFICGILSLLIAVFTEPISFQMLYLAKYPILYGGLLSVAAGFTLQVIGQEKVQPAMATIILNMESVVAVFGGWLILNEDITIRMLIGATLMFVGVMAAKKDLITVSTQNKI